MSSNAIAIKGMFRDRLIEPDSTISYDSGWNSNCIVQTCRILISGYMKNDAPSGIQYLSVGRGDDSWDNLWNTATPPTPDPSISGLVQPYDPPITVPPDSPILGKEYLHIDYLDANDITIVGTPSHKLLIHATLKPGYPAPVQFNTYPLREFGLFGTFGGTPYMINCVRHPVIYKDAAATLVREIKLYF